MKFWVKILNIANKKQKPYESAKKSPFTFSPKKINLSDDAFHGSKAPRYTEWWYFDAVFDNGYSIQLSVRLLSIIKNRVVPVFKRLDIYKNGELLTHNKKRYSWKQFQASKEKPDVKLADKQVIKGEIKDNQLKYKLDFKVNNNSAKLELNSSTEGWKGNNPGGDMWAVIIPRADVKGAININGEEIKVKGIGYHDHNWDVRASAAKNHGWFWGKINFDRYTITWASIFKDRNIGQPLLIINKVGNGFINLKPEEIYFRGNDMRATNGKMIPHEIILKGKNNDAELDIKMKLLKIHHVKMMLRMHYWRYHVSCKGFLKINGKKETVDETHIAEFLKFK